MKKLILLMPFFFLSCSYIREHPDSAGEEFVEELIEEATGLDVDLTSTDGIQLQNIPD
jgi:hypothetical protein